MSKHLSAFEAYLKAGDEFLNWQRNRSNQTMSNFEPLKPQRFDYIEVKGQPEVDYKKLYELQRYTSKRLCVIILQYIDMLKKTVKGNDAIIDDCNLAKEKIEKLMLEM